MPMSVEAAQGESFRRVQKFAPGRVPYHPACLQSSLGREVESPLQRHCGGAARGENCRASSGGEKLIEAPVHAGTKLRPRLYALERQSAICPLRNDNFKQALERGAPLIRLGRMQKGGM